MEQSNEADRRSKGYQHIDQESIDLINELKEHGKTSAALQQRVVDKLSTYYGDLWKRIEAEVVTVQDDLRKNGLLPPVGAVFMLGSMLLGPGDARSILGKDHPLIIELDNYDREAAKWAELGLTEFQKGTMFLVRAVARNPEG